MNTKIRTLLIPFTLTASVMLFALTFSVAFGETIYAQGLAIPSEQTPEQFNQNCTDETTCTQNNPIVQWINFFINLFSVVILVGASIMIAVAGIQYSSARDNPQGVQAAKQKIWNVLIGLLAFFFFYAFMQWLIPGGVF